jgi:hypothetical protein
MEQIPAMAMPTVLVAPWSNGLIALADNAFNLEWAGQSAKALLRDSSGNALAIVGGGHSLSWWVCRSMFSPSDHSLDFGVGM